MSFEKIIISQQNRIIFIKPEKIIFCRSDNCYTNIHFLEGQQILIVKSLTKLHKELLPEDFLRVSQSFIINKRFIQSIDKKKRCIELENGEMIPFTVSLKELLLMIGKDNSLIPNHFIDPIEN